MILSYKYRFIFLKNPKTAGTSVEIALSKFCGPDDIITPIDNPDEELRRSLGYRGKQNYEASFSDYSLRDYLRLYRERKCRFYSHSKAVEVKKYVGDKIWNSYYKFTVVRNPWDRLVSEYYWAIRNKPSPPDLDTFIERRLAKARNVHKPSLYLIDDRIAVDRICRFENLTDDLEGVRQHLDIPEPLELPKTKHKSRTEKSHYREVLNGEQRDKIAEVYKRDIELFGYEF